MGTPMCSALTTTSAKLIAVKHLAVDNYNDMFAIWGPKNEHKPFSERGKARGFPNRGFPNFCSGKVLIVSRTLSGMFLVGGSNRPKKRKKTNRKKLKKKSEKSRKSRERPEKDKKGQKKEGQVQIGKDPPV